MAKNKKFLFHVKINEARGYPKGVYTVLSETGSEYTLRSSNGDTFNLFKVHCFRDHETMQADKNRRITNAEKIGRK